MNHPDIIILSHKQHCSERERGKLQNKAKLANIVPRLLAGIVDCISQMSCKSFAPTFVTFTSFCCFGHPILSGL